MSAPIRLIFLLASACALVGTASPLQGDVPSRLYGQLPDGRPLRVFILRNASGSEAQILDYGATLVSLTVPDRDGHLANVVIDPGPARELPSDSWQRGRTIGRFAGRIAQARFTLDGKEYQLTANFGPHHLHGGEQGFSRVIWQPAGNDKPRSVTLRYRSPDGEEGYPGTLNVQVTYTLGEDNSLVIDYLASTDQPTIISLTNHAYYSLGGAGTSGLLEAQVTLHAAKFLKIDSSGIPTGVRVPVHGTPMDFLTPHAIGERIDADDEQIRFGRGYDHTFLLDPPGSGGLSRAARVVDPGSGRTLEVLTTYPAVQFFVSRSLGGFCIEPAEFPDAPNHPDFPSAVLRPGQEWRQSIVLRFGTTSGSR